MFEQPTLGTITIFAGPFNPENWMLCQGQTLSINEYQALYTLIGTTYGGDGVNNFLLPDLRSKVPIHTSPTYPLGSQGGTQSVTLTSANLPTHTHADQGHTIGQRCASANGNLSNPQGAYPAPGSVVYNSSSDGTMMGQYAASGNTITAGASQSIPIMQPYQAINYLIVVQGLYPNFQ